MNLFSKRFNCLFEADETQQAPAPASDREAMEQQLDTAKPEDFDVQQTQKVQQVDHDKINQLRILKEWIGEIDSFIEFLNGTNTSSDQAQLHSASCETVFEEIARSEKKKIARLAAELSSLSESFKGYLISSND